MIELRAESKMSEGWRKIIHALVEVSANLKMSDSLREIIDWSVEFGIYFLREIHILCYIFCYWFVVIPKRKMCERRREMVHGLVEVLSKGKMDQRRRKRIHRMIEIIPKSKDG